MSRLEKILKSFLNSNDLETSLESLYSYQNNLLKNYSNPVFSNSDKNKILKYYHNLKEAGKILYRYNTLKQNNLDAEIEKASITDKILKGGVSYTHYIWRAENKDTTCELCKSLDGKEFDQYDEVPQRPHPNCKCTVVVIDDDSEQLPPEQPEKNKWIMPCDGPITSGFGWRIDPVFGTKSYHNGWDIAVPIGTPIQAIADGKVLFAGSADPNGYGKFVVIDHGKIDGITVTSEYGHISSWNVSVGQQVKQGDMVAKSGNEGKSTGPHLHMTIREGAYRGTGVDPSIYIMH